jgi:hypothetical protein
VIISEYVSDNCSLYMKLALTGLLRAAENKRLKVPFS